MTSKSLMLKLHVANLERSIDLQNDDVLLSCWASCFDELAKFVVGMGLKQELADDVLQEVYLKAMTKAPQNLNAVDLRRWLFRVAANQCRLEHRKQGRWFRVLEKLKFAKPQNIRSKTSTEQIISNEQNVSIQSAIASLHENQRAVLVLKYFNNFDSATIGSVLNMPDATVRSHLRRGRMELAKQLDGMQCDGMKGDSHE